MGQAIVYCWKCQEKILAADFENGRAFQAGGRTSCQKCAPELAATLPEHERQALLLRLGATGSGQDPSRPPQTTSTSRNLALRPEQSRTPRRATPTVPPSASADPRLFVWSGIAIGGILLVGMMAFFMRSAGKEEERDRSVSDRRAPSGGSTDPLARAETPADRAIRKAEEAARAGADLDAAIRLWDEAVAASEQSPRHAEALQARLALLVRRKESYAQELSRLEVSVEGLLNSGEAKKAAEFLRSARRRHDSPDWTERVDQRLSAVLEKEKAAADAELAEERLKLLPREGLALWLRADQGVVLSGTRVSRWLDQSGNHRDASQGAGADQPSLLPAALQGRAGIGFDGVRSSMRFQLPVNGLPGITIFLVSCSASDGATANGSDASAIYWDAAGANGKMYVAPYPSRIRFKLGAGRPNGDLSYQRPSALAQRATLTVVRKDASVDSLYTDGTLALQRTGMGPTIAECRDQAALGLGKNNSHFSGSIAEILIWKRALPDPERERVEKYLSAKYGLPSK